MAVFTPLSQGEIIDLLQRYDLPALRKEEGIRSGVENTNYMLTLEDDSKRILTLFERRVQAEELPFFIELMEKLALQGVPCPLPVRAKNGEALHSVKGKPSLIVTFLQGGEVKRIEDHHLFALGQAMAKLHLAGKSVTSTRNNDLSVSGWKPIAALVAPRADSITPGLASMIEHELNYLSTHWPSHLPQGVIHADLFPDNVFFDKDGNLSGIIDFYFACNDALAYDIAVCINAWCFEPHEQLRLSRSRQLLKGYNSIRPLTLAERDALPLLTRGAALRFLLTRANDWLFPQSEALVTAKDPMEYVAKLRFHQQAKNSGDYGL